MSDASRGADLGSGELTLSAVVERKDPSLPRFVVVPSQDVAGWGLEGTTTVEGTLDDVQLGRLSLKRWDEERWFIDLPKPVCRNAGVNTGDRVTLVLCIAPDALPVELERLLARDSSAKAAWKRLTASQRRMLREHVASAKQPATRERRALRVLGS